MELKMIVLAIFIAAAMQFVDCQCPEGSHTIKNVNGCDYQLFGGVEVTQDEAVRSCGAINNVIRGELMPVNTDNGHLNNFLQLLWNSFTCNTTYWVALYYDPTDREVHAMDGSILNRSEYNWTSGTEPNSSQSCLSTVPNESTEFFNLQPEACDSLRKFACVDVFEPTPCAAGQINVPTYSSGCSAKCVERPTTTEKATSVNARNVTQPGNSSDLIDAETTLPPLPNDTTHPFETANHGTCIAYHPLLYDPNDSLHDNAVYEGLDHSLRQLDKMDKKTLKLCENFGRTSLDSGQPQQALTIVTKAISLVEKLDGEIQETQALLGLLYCLAAEAYQGLRQQRDAVQYYHLARKAEKFSNVEETELKSRLKKLQLLLSSTNEEDGRTRVTRTIGLAGGEIVLTDGAITFPENAFTVQMILYASTVDDVDSDQGDLIPISTTMRLAPNTNLKAAAEVILKTWACPTDGDQALVYYRESYASLWKDPRPITLQEDGSAKFQIEKFCEYRIFILAKAALNWDFKIQACLFFNKETKKISNRLTSKCETCADALIRKMAVVNFKPICTENPTLIVKVEDEVEVRLENIRDEGGDTAVPPEKRAKITIDFLKDKTHGVQDFPLDRDCKGLVDFNHIVQLYRRNEAIGNPTIHDADRVNLDSQERGQTNVSAGVIVTDNASVRMVGVNLDAQQQAN